MATVTTNPPTNPQWSERAIRIARYVTHGSYGTDKRCAILDRIQLGLDAEWSQAIDAASARVRGADNTLLHQDKMADYVKELKK